MELRPYQTDIINQTINSDESTLIQVPTGGGKTVIAKEIVQYLTKKLNKQVLFVAPQINLMEQTKEEFQELFPLIIHGKEDNTSNNVLISTLQTASRRDINPDIIIIDEVHHGFEGKMIAKLRRDNPNTRIIGLSATPYDKNGKQLQGFGLILDRYDMKYMIENNYLVNLQVEKLVHIRNLDTIKPPKGSDYNIDALGKIMCNDKTIMEIVRTTGEYIWDKKTIVFAVNISHAELLTKAYQDAGFAARVIHSELPNKHLAVEQEIQDFKDGKTKILVSVAMLTTGFNVPDTDVAVIARPTKSQNLYKQMVGRVLRTADGKTHALLLDCGNVIDELGYPLEPIKEKTTKEIGNGKQKCGLCGSEALKLIHKDDKSYWECKECNHLKPIEQGSYECMWCKRRYTHDSKFIIKNNALYLYCEDCQDNPMYQPTKISEFTGQVGFVSVDDNSQRKQEANISLELNAKKKINNPANITPIEKISSLLKEAMSQKELFDNQEINSLFPNHSPMGLYLMIEFNKINCDDLKIRKIMDLVIWFVNIGNISPLEFIPRLDDLEILKKYENNLDFIELKKFKNYEFQFNNIIRFQNICKKYVSGGLKRHLRKDKHLSKLWEELKNERSAQKFYYSEIKIYLGLIDLANNKYEMDSMKQIQHEIRNEQLIKPLSKIELNKKRQLKGGL